MDLGAFADEVSDVVAGICGDRVVESHAQASHVLDALCRRPGMNDRELAAVFGVSFEQLSKTREVARLRAEGREAERQAQDPVWSSLCSSDAVHTWNVLTERINQAAHWREEFRDLANADEAGDGDSDSDADAAGGLCASPELPSPSSPSGDPPSRAPAQRGVGEASADTRAKARALLARHLDPAGEPLRRHLAERLDDEIFESCPSDKEYRQLARSVAANLRRNTMLAAGYATGRVPPQWLVLADAEALAPRSRQLQRRQFRGQSMWESREDDDSANLRRKMWDVAKGTSLAAPPQCEEVVA